MVIGDDCQAYPKHDLLEGTGVVLDKEKAMHGVRASSSLSLRFWTLRVSM